MTRHSSATESGCAATAAAPPPPAATPQENVLGHKLQQRIGDDCLHNYSFSLLPVNPIVLFDAVLRPNSHVAVRKLPRAPSSNPHAHEYGWYQGDEEGSGCTPDDSTTCKLISATAQLDDTTHAMQLAGKLTRPLTRQSQQTEVDPPTHPETT